MELIQSKIMQNDGRNRMENIKVGDVLQDRDTRRVGREVKVIWVETDSVTVEVTKDSFNSKKTTVGNSTDIARNRLKKGYTLKDTALTNEEVVASITAEKVKWQEINNLEPAADDEIVDDPSSLEDALNSAGYFWLPPVEDLVEAVKLEAPVLTKTALVYLIHNVIRESLVTGQ